MHRSFCRFSSTILLILVAIASQTMPAHAQGVATTVTVGAFFDHLMSQVKEAEEKAIAGGMVLEIGAGGEVALAIQQAKAAYTSSLNLTLAQLDAQTQAQLNTIQSMATAYTTKTYHEVSDLEDQAYAIVTSLPLSNDVPRLFRYTPRYTTGSMDPLAPQMEFTLHGHFTDAPLTGYEPTASLAGTDIDATAKSTNFITFMLPSAAFKPAASAVTTQYVTIDVPYRTGTFLHHRRHSSFTVPISTLPTRCGTVTVTINTPTATVVRQQIVSPEMSQDSSQDDIKDGGEHADLAIHPWAATAGWRVIPSSVHYDMIWSQGTQGFEKDWWYSRNISTLQKAVLCFSTEHHRFGTSGKIRFRIVFTEEKDAIANSVSLSRAELKWGDRKTFDVPSGATWKGSFVGFDGKTLEFNSAYSNTYINVTQTGSLVVISTIP